MFDCIWLCGTLLWLIGNDGVYNNGGIVSLQGPLLVCSREGMGDVVMWRGGASSSLGFLACTTMSFSGMSLGISGEWRLVSVIASCSFICSSPTSSSEE